MASRSNRRRPDVELRFLGVLDAETGRVCCVWCGSATQPPRRSWCGDSCVMFYKIAKGDQRAARRYLWKKERGVCQLCRSDVNKVRRAVIEQHGYVPHVERHRVRWEADHIVPIVEGGPLTPENLRTLCIGCHRQVTRELRGRLARKVKS